VADVTTKENRSRGMAFIGIAFALGFILGPAMGGILSTIDLSVKCPSLIGLGVNPFSMPALVAAILSLFNFISILVNFHETLPPEKRGKGTIERTANILKLFKPAPYAGVNGTNISHFLFLTAFSGMEFTLTFLAVERLGYSSMDNAYMFIFIGFVIGMVQGKETPWGEVSTDWMDIWEIRVTSDGRYAAKVPAGTYRIKMNPQVTSAMTEFVTTFTDSFVYVLNLKFKKFSFSIVSTNSTKTFHIT
jgi:MFS family permease